MTSKLSSAQYYSNMPDVIKNHTVLSMDPELDLDMTGKSQHKPLSGTIHPFHKSHTTFFGRYHEEFRGLLSIKKTRRICVCFLLTLFSIIIMLSWYSSTNSIALMAYTCLLCFDGLSLLVCLVTSWSSMKQEQIKSNHGAINDLCHKFSYQRTEILAVFSSVVIAQLCAIFIMKEAIERMIEQPEIHIGRLIPGVMVGLCSHILLSCFVENKAFYGVQEASYSSWMQEHAADISRNICGIFPMLRSVLLPRVDPLLLVFFSGASVLLLLDVILQINSYFFMDTLFALLIVIMIFATMWPITVCSGNILLQTTSPHVLGQLDKLLSEAQTLDGVLEIQNESFYTLSLGLSGLPNSSRPVLAGSLQVRIRRDADEQMVLAHVTNRLSPLVPYLTAQVVKDDWRAPTGPHPMGNLIHQSKATKSKITPGMKYISGFNKPAAAVSPIVQSPPKDDKPKEDFDFTSPVKGSPAVSVIKPKSSHSDIEKMYRAAGFKSPPSTSSNFSFSHSFTVPKNNFNAPPSSLLNSGKYTSTPAFPQQPAANFPVFPKTSKFQTKFK